MTSGISGETERPAAGREGTSDGGYARAQAGTEAARTLPKPHAARRGHIFMAEPQRKRARLTTATLESMVSTLAGSEAGFADGPSSDAKFLRPRTGAVGRIDAQPLSAVLRELCEKMMRLLRFAFSREKLRRQPCIELYFATACGAGPAGPSLRAAYQAETSVAVFILASISATSPS